VSSANETGRPSRLSKTNRADRPDGSYSPSARRSRKQPLTERDGVSLREEVRDFGALDGDRATTWNRSIRQYRQYIRDRDGVASVFENETGDQVRGSDPHRFDPDYSGKQYAKLKDLERGVSDAYGKRLHTAMLTFTASGAPGGDPLPPVDHLDDLLSSWDAIRRALDRALGDRRYARLAILEPHPGDGQNNGYLHIHLAVFVDGVVAKDDLAPVIQAHLRNCDLAEPDAHDPTDDTTISIRHAGADRADLEDDEQLDELAIYLAEYLGTYGDDDPLEEPEHVQAANALLWATNRQRWRPCSTAQQFMAYDPPETDTEWSLIGIEKDGEVIPCDSSSGGVSTFTTSTDPPPDSAAAD
jgi:hypothetical protein